ncbi:hypothetical protein AB0D94_17010 [Streptomyces sp. NPDC048255]|uniref:hypothetical protein n=1 Tax=Streptomyces sp. NPDC048255 TaxID=3154713 RepID=UPI0033D923A0
MRHRLVRAVAAAGLLVGLAAGGVAAGGTAQAAAQATAVVTAPGTGERSTTADHGPRYARAAAAAAADDPPELPTIEQPVSEGTFTFSGDPGDEVTQGRSESFGTPGQSFLVYRSTGSNMAEIRVRDGDTWWYVAFGAPAGRRLTAGTYAGATLFPFHENAPGIDFSGDGRYCTGLTGSFTVHRIDWSPQGWLNFLDADFEQRCEGSAAASRGSVRIQAPPASPPLALAVTAARIGSVTPEGEAVLHGTLRCNKSVWAAVHVYVVQQQGGRKVGGWLRQSVDCTAGAAVAWQGKATADGSARYQDGWADTVVGASAHDWEYMTYTEAPEKKPRVCLGRCGS